MPYSVFMSHSSRGLSVMAFYWFGESFGVGGVGDNSRGLVGKRKTAILDVTPLPCIGICIP